MLITKADGNKEGFDKKKIIRTCLRAGADRKTAEEIAGYVEKQINNGDTTRKIYKLILAELEKGEDKTAFAYRLREAVSELPPVTFEHFTKRILELHGYKCTWNRLIKGECITHQVDIVAKKEDKLFLVECKHHTNHHRLCGLGKALQLWARLDDIQNGFKNGKNKYNFTQAWLFNNTKFSNHVKQYANAKNIKLSGWRYKGNDSVECMVHEKKVYPITLLKIDSQLKEKLMANNMFTFLDIAHKKDELRKLVGAKLTNDILGQVKSCIG